MSKVQDINIELPPIAEDVEFDPSNCEALTTDNVQEAIDELCNVVAVSASPGFTWGKSGNVSSNTWLLNDTVPSNKTGRVVFLNSATLEKVFVSNENVNTFDLEIYEHDGTTFTLITTVSIVAQRAQSFTIASLALTANKELAVKLVNGSGKNVVCGCLLSGSLV